MTQQQKKGSRRQSASSTRKGSNKRRQQNRPWLKWVVIAAVLLILIIGGAIAKFMLNTTREDITLLVPRNCTAEMLRDSLNKHFGADYARDVMLMLKVSGVDLAKRDGAYKVKEGTSAAKTAWMIRGHHQSDIKLSIRHLRTIDDLAIKLAANTDNTPEQVLAALQDEELLNKYDVEYEQVRMLFMEDTYNIHYGWEARVLVSLIAKNYGKFWNDDRRAKAKKLGLTPQQVMIIASIVDEESNMSDEKGDIGRLYINRLNKGMKLQADPTAKYAVGDFSLRRITGKHTANEGRYNTYKYAGLPPGPIRTTSARTVDAILDSKPSDYLFMCAKEDFSGYHNFAATYEEHKQNARRYQQELDRRNIH